MRPITVAILFSGLVIAGPDPVRMELKQLQGTWDVVSVEEDGKKLPAEMTRGWTLTVKGEAYTFRAGVQMVEGIYKPDPASKPKALDAERTIGEEKGKTLRGIYEAAGDELKMCFSRPGEDRRPVAFTTGEGGGHRLYVFNRAKK